MLNILFFTPVILYFAAMVLQFAGAAFKMDKVRKLAWVTLIAGVLVQTAYMIARGVAAGRVPLANQFDFANAFAWGTAVIGIFFKVRGKKTMDWMVTLAAPCAFLLISYAALQPREITELMPALTRPFPSWKGCIRSKATWNATMSSKVLEGNAS